MQSSGGRSRKVRLCVSRPRIYFGIVNGTSFVYIVPVARSAAFQIVLAALVAIDHLLLVIDRLARVLGLITQRVGHLLPCLLVDDREFVPAVVVEKRHHRLGHLDESQSID